MPDVAIAVVSFNTRELLRACLASLAADAEAGRAEVWVLDNASTDGSAAMVRDAFSWVRLIESHDNLGFGAAVNRVAAQTGTPWIAAANADVAPEPGALARLLAAGAADPGAGALAPRLLLPGGGTQHSVFAFPGVRFTLAFAAGLARGRWGDRLCLPGRWDPDVERRVPWAIGAFLLVRRTAWDAAGGFDPAQWMYAEDLDLGWRLRRAGWATRYGPGARVRHAESAATRAAWGEERTLRWQRATYVWLLRRRGPAVALAVAALHVAGAAARREWRWARIHARAALDARR